MEPSAPPPPYKESKYQKINNLLSKYDINPMLSEKMSILEEYEIVLLLDDSGSMNTPLNDHTSHATRWDELKHVIKIIIDISTTYDDDGIDLYFLNRGYRKNIRSYTEIGDLILNPPCGRTPLNQRVIEILRNYSSCLKPLLLVIATDGVPTDSYGNINVQEFKITLLNKNHSKVYVSFLACSDNDNDIDYLNDLDKTVPNIDTLDDYISEKKEVIAAQGNDFKYSFEDHIVRLLLGPICQELDKLDENKMKKSKSTIKNNGCICKIL